MGRETLPKFRVQCSVKRTVDRDLEVVFCTRKKLCFIAVGVHVKIQHFWYSNLIIISKRKFVYKKGLCSPPHHHKVRGHVRANSPSSTLVHSKYFFKGTRHVHNIFSTLFFQPPRNEEFSSNNLKNFTLSEYYRLILNCFTNRVIKPSDSECKLSGFKLH